MTQGGGVPAGRPVTSRERVLLTLGGGRPDRVPVDFMGTGCGLGLEAHRRFLAWTRGAGPAVPPGSPGAAVPPGAAGPTGPAAEPQAETVTGPPCPTVYDPSLLERFGVDFRRVGPAPGEPRDLAAEAEAVRATTGRAVVARAPCSGPFGWCVERVGLEAFLTTLRRREVEAMALVGQATEAILAGYRSLLGEVGPFVDLVEVADDYAYARGALFAPATFEAVFQPALGLIIETIHELAPRARVLFHSCGALTDLLPGLIAAGVDVLSPLDPTARGMTPEILRDTAARLRTSRGQKLVLHGGLNPAVLTGSEGDIRREVRRLVDTLGAEGGYILAPASDILEDVPPRQLEAFFRIATEGADRHQAGRARSAPPAGPLCTRGR